MTPQEKIASAKARKIRREEKRVENEALNSFKSLQDDPGRDFNLKPATRPARRKKTPTLSKLKKNLWDEISLLVRSWSHVCLACKVNSTEVAAHIVPSNEGAITRYFLPNLYPCCIACNGLEKWNRATWVFFHRDLFGEDYVDALYAMVDDQDKMPMDKRFQLKKWWVLEQTYRVNKLHKSSNRPVDITV